MSYENSILQKARISQYLCYNLRLISQLNGLLVKTSHESGREPILGSIYSYSTNVKFIVLLAIEPPLFPRSKCLVLND